MIDMRKGFSLLVAIFTILLVALVASYIFYASSSIAKEGGLQYQKDQAELLARSYTEYAVMAISANDRNGTGTCINDINATIGTDPSTGEGYRVHVAITYIGNKHYVNNCSRVAAKLSDSDIDTLSVIIDVYVEYRDIFHPSLYDKYKKYVPWQTYHKRSLQKI